jgi:tetratricopeptide (TPR) repeat protein
MNAEAALRPLDDAAADVRRLDDYQTADQLSDAVARVAAAVDRALRTLLRNDPEAPDEHRLNAFSPDYSREQVVQSLRARNRISLETAGALHELQAAAGRAEDRAARAADADLTRRAVVRLREELEAAAAPPSGAAAGTAPPGASPPPVEDDPVVEEAPPRVGATPGRWMAWLAAAIAVVVVLGLAWVFARGGEQEVERAMTAFRAGRLDSAAAGFERVLEDRPGDVSVMLYLGRTYRRLDRPADAAAVLREAAAADAEDGDVRRELGHLFMDLGQPESAVRQYERALEQDPEQPLNWAALIRALRAVGDPRAEELLQGAPDEVRSALVPDP